MTSAVSLAAVFALPLGAQAADGRSAKPKIKPPPATAKALKPPPLRVAPPMSRRRAKARVAFHDASIYPGISDCPNYIPSGATSLATRVRGLLVWNPQGGWYRYWNGIATRGAGWEVISWEGPYWIWGNRWDLVWNSARQPLYVSDGGGSSIFTFRRDDHLGGHYIVDNQTGETRWRWTTPIPQGAGYFCDDYYHLFP
jgi:hypothetical protein